MNKAKLKALIQTYISSRIQLSLATYGNHPWIATLYYSSDQNLNVYVLTDPDSIHAQHIAKNPNVAVSIADSPQLPTDKKSGIQLWGVAEQIKGKKRIIHALALWRSSLAVSHSKYSYEGMVKKLITGRMYVIRPKQIKLFHEGLWEDGNEKILLYN